VLFGGADSTSDGAVTSYDSWLAWKHGAQLRERALRSKFVDDRLSAEELDWGDQSTLEEFVAFIAPDAEAVVMSFYDELFTRVPGVRKLFPADLTVQRDRLLAALLALVAGGARPSALAVELEQLGRDHRKYGVRTAQYQAVGQALLAALARHGGRHWTPAVERAWAARYSAAATVMRQAADQDQDRPPFWYGTVVGREVHGWDVAILRVRPHQPYPYVAGQYATLESPRLPRVWRPYSMATAPIADQALEFHVRAAGRGGLSDALAASEPGDVVRIGPPQGSVTLNRIEERPLLFVAGGTGWSTVKALLTQCARESSPSVSSRLLVSCRPGEPYDPAFGPFVRRLPNLGTTLVHSAEELRAELAPDRLTNRDVDAFVSGPPGLVATATRLLHTAGVPHTRIHHDEPLSV